MTRKNALVTLALVAVLAMLSIGGAALAQTSANFNLEWHVVAGGGQPASSARFAVNSTVGQGTAGSILLSSSRFIVGGGFQPGGGTTNPPTIYLPLVLRNSP
jgi:opacity protein-like surface antigen